MCATVSVKNDSERNARRCGGREKDGDDGQNNDDDNGDDKKQSQVGDTALRVARDGL